VISSWCQRRLPTIDNFDFAPDILVAGGGPAGCAAAIGLRRLGFSVALVHMPRPWPSVEGISARTLEGMRNAGLLRAAKTAAAASPRRVSWNGESSAANSEHLVQRRIFDAALLEDAAGEGVQLLPGQLRQCQYTPEQSIAHIDTPADGRLAVSSRFLVEARGRTAPSATNQLRGPGTVSFLRTSRGTPAAAGSSVCSFADGWAWQARGGDGWHFLQFTVTSQEQSLPNRTRLRHWFQDELNRLPTDMRPPSGERQASDITARGSSSILQGELVTPRMLRVGDAAMAVDPLSGNGIFQALSSALVAPPVINTLLQYPAESQLAMQFYRDRVRQTFLRFARLGRDFYRLETNWPESDFWRQRQAWPDDLAAHGESAPKLLGIELRPVVAGDRIRERKVAVTSDQPLGIWHVGGVELAPLLEQLPTAASPRRAVLAERAVVASAGDAGRRAMLEAWLRRYQQL
jgi:flavin-dependent dehydrogenase